LARIAVDRSSILFTDCVEGFRVGEKEAQGFV